MFMNVIVKIIFMELKVKIVYVLCAYNFFVDIFNYLLVFGQWRKFSFRSVRGGGGGGGGQSFTNFR